jgi:hypothetical protein
MSNSNWNSGFSFARLIGGAGVLIVIALAVSYFQVKQSYNSQRNYEGTAEQDTGYQHCLKIPIIIDTCTKKYDAAIQKKRDDDDLLAQQEMADWASYTVVIGALGVILSFGGLLFVYRTLQHTAQAVEISNKHLIADNRPWIHVKPKVEGDISFLEDGSCLIAASVGFKNVGHGPALKIKIFSDEFPFDAYDLVAETKQRIDRFKEEYKSGEQRGSTLFPGEKDSKRITLKVSRDVVAHHMSHPPQGESFFLSCCFLFAAVYESTIGEELKFHTSVIEVVNQDLGNGGMNAVLISRNEPRRIVRSGSICLYEYPATYQAE